MNDIKKYELLYTHNRVNAGMPIIARLDGRSFKKFTKKFKRPYDVEFRKLMAKSLLFMMEEFDAHYGYTQSDEISLLWHYNENQNPMFGGKLSKLNSILASGLTGYFNNNSKHEKLAMFDCRVFNLPDYLVVSYFKDRAHDCVRNSIFMAAREHFSHKELVNVSASKALQKLKLINYPWEELPNYFKIGITAYRKPVKIISRNGTAIRNRVVAETKTDNYRRLKCLLDFH